MKTTKNQVFKKIGPVIVALIGATFAFQAALADEFDDVETEGKESVSSAPETPQLPKTMESDLTAQELEELLGTGVGNGGEGSESEFIASLSSEFGTTICDGGGCGIPEFNAWCGKVSKILRKALNRAEKRVGQTDLRTAGLILQRALDLASASLQYDPETGGPITRLLVGRGAQMGRSLRDGEVLALRKAKARGAKREQLTLMANRFLVSRVRFMSLYISKMILETGRSLDHYVLPFHFRYGRCRSKCDGDFIDRFSEQFRLFVKAQIRFLSDYFTVVRFNDDGFTELYPRGVGMHYLIAAEHMGAGMGIDLQSYSDLHACTGMDLEVLSEDLRRFNWLNDRTIYGTEWDALRDAYNEFENAHDDLSSCRYVRPLE